MGKLSYRTLRENVVDEIRIKILNQELAPGMRIVEQNLSDELGVSRGPIREALRQLEQEGLVEYTRNVGCSVKKITLEDIYEIYLLRSMYEVVAVRLYEGDFSDEDFARMDEILELMKDLNSEGEAEEEMAKLVTYDRMLHTVIVEKAEFTRLTKAWSELDYGNVICFYAGNSDRRAGIERQYSIHKKLVDILRTKDEEKICNAITEHYMSTVRRLMQDEGMVQGNIKDARMGIKQSERLLKRMSSVTV